MRPLTAPSGLVILACTMLLAFTAAAQEPLTSRPRLVVLITLDQFPHEYLARYEQHFGPGGFRTFIDGGAVFTNASFKHARTSTGPGHAVLLTGTYGRTNGIIGNSWYDRQLGRSVYCAEDRSVRILGNDAEGRSPANLLSYTFGDMLRISTGFQSKVIAISNKDRAAIMPGGKFANLALWMMDSLFVTSTYYTPTLPSWVRDFNASGLINSFFGRTWERSLPLSAYTQIDDDDAPYEDAPAGMGRTFPHPVRGDSTHRITSSYYEALLASPYSAEVLAALARAAVRGEQLGSRGVTDLLSVSFSTPDYTGHAFGPYSHEMLDMTVRMDRILADLLKFLDQQVGLANCLLVLTADHGVSPIPAYLNHRSGREVVRRFAPKAVAARAESLLTARFGAPSAGAWIQRFSGGSLFLAPAPLTAAGINAETAARAVVDDLQQLPFVRTALTREQVRTVGAASRFELRIRNSFHDRLSGDAVVVFDPAWQSDPEGHGASHGDPVEADAHVVLMMRGKGVVPGLYHNEASPADIAPTLSALTGVEFTPFREGRVLHEALTRPPAAKRVTR